MRHVLALVALLSLGLGLTPATAEAGPAVDCGPGDGREELTPAGFELDFEAPAVAIPELVTPADTRIPPLSPHRTASWWFRANFAPAASATVDAVVSWENPSDYDLYFLDEDGERIAASDRANIEGGTFDERVTLELEHCQLFRVWVRNWAGQPVQDLHLDIDVTPGSDLLACAAGDPAPGCAGKAAGDAPDFVADDATRLFLGGDPGAVAMVHGYQNNGAPFRGTLESQRPTTGVSNSHTRTFVGFHDQYQNPFVPHFTTTFAEPRDIKGTVSSLLWLSSPTADDTTKLYVTLYVDDGGAVGQQVISGSAISEVPAPVVLSFPDVDFPDASSVTIQAATKPLATSTGETGNPSDGLMTLLYGSVQFQSRVTLP